MKKKLSVYFILFLSLIFISCNPMKKNVMKDSCDDMKEVVISESNGKFALVVKEEIFQATSKSDNGGIRNITGYTEFRLSSYDLNTGELLKRLELGEIRENECILLGMTKSKLWYKSIDSELSFHARDPVTLDIIVTEKMVTDANPFLQNNISKPEWNSIQKFYGFDNSIGMPVISDNSGYLYSIDPVTLKAEKITSSIMNIRYDENVLTSSVYLNNNEVVYLSGNPRTRFKYVNKDFDEPSFLKGEIIKSSTETEMPEEYLLSNEFKESVSKKNPLRISRKTEPEYSFAKGQIITNDKSIFILSRTDVTDQAKVLISKVKFDENYSPSLQWETVLDNIFRDPDKALDQSGFEMVFSKGNPDLSTMRVAYADNKLIFIFMLKAVCLDINSGKILWSRDL